MLRRRKILASIIIGVTGLLGYFSIVPPSIVHGDEPIVEPGSETNLKVEVKWVSGLTFRQLPDLDMIEFRTSEVSIEPEPTGQADSYPPIWSWMPRRPKAEVVCPVKISDGAQPRTYTYSVEAFEGRTHRSDSVVKQFKIQVSES